MATKTETLINELKINYLTEELYQEALVNNEINENEIYMTPRDTSYIDEELTKKINLPVNESGINDYGLKGQFAVSDGNGGITWMTVIDGNEVGY